MEFPIDPIRFASGNILLAPGGKVVFQFDPIPEDAPEDWRAALDRYMATLADMGHIAYVGSPAEFAIVREAHNDQAL